MFADTGNLSPPRDKSGPRAPPVDAAMAHVHNLDRWPTWVGYVAAATATAVIVFLLPLAGQFNDRLAATLLIVPVVVGVWLGGLGPGIAAAALVTLARHFLWVAPGRTDTPNLIDEAALTAVCLLIAVAIATLRRARRESDARLAALMRVSPTGMFLSRGSDGRFLGVSDAFLELLGYTRAELVGRTSHELGIWADPGERNALRPALCRDRRILNHELHLRRKSGEIITLLGSAELLKFHGEWCLLGTIMDITDRRRTEASLAATESMFRGLVEQSLAGIYVLQDGRFPYVNAAFANMFGYDSPAEICGKVDVQDFVAPTDRALVMENIRRRTAGEATDLQYSFNAIRRDGTAIVVEVHGRSFEYAGRPAVIGVLLDITERRQLEVALQRQRRNLEQLAAERTVALEDALAEIRRSEERYRVLFTASQVPMLLIDTASGAIVEGNTAACAYYGYDADRLRQLHVGDINALPPDEVREKWERALREPQSCFDCRHRLASGEVRDVEVHAGPMEVDGRRLIYSIVHDVTARKNVEADLQRLQAMLARAHAIARVDPWTWDVETGLFRNPPRGAPNVGVDGPTVSWELLMTIVHPEDRDAMRNAWTDALAGRAGYDIEHRVVVNGEVRWLHVMAEVEHDADGKPLRATGMTQDITARRQVERNLREAREALEHARAMARLDSWRLDLGTGMFTYPTYGSPNIGLDRPSLPWDDLIELIHPDDRATMLAAWADALAGKTEYDIEHRMNVNGEVRWIHAKAEIERDPTGRPLRATGMTQDVTARRRLEDALREGEARQRLVMESAEDAIFITETSGRYLYANPAALRALGYTLDEFLKLSVRDTVTRSELVRFPKHMRAIRRGERRLLDWHLRSRNGPAILFELTTVQLPDSRYLAIGRDVTARRAAEEKLEVAASVFRNAAEGILITDVAGTILDVNQGFIALTGFGRDEVVGRNPRLLRSGHHDEAFFAALWRSLQDTGQWQGEIWNRRKSGALFACHMTISAARDRAGRVHRYIGLFSDVTELKRRQAAVEHLAYHDTLTKLPNRTLLEDRLRQALARAARQNLQIGLGYLDLDGFKAVNDRFGHTTGDRLLAEIARRLQNGVRAQDTVARFGGDEFILLLTDIKNEEEWRAIFERTLHVIAEPCVLGDGERITVYGSLGVTLYPQDTGSADELLRHADQAMYRAKQAGRNRLCVYAPAHARPVASTD